MEMISAKNIGKTFDEHTVLRDVSPEVHSGEIFGLIGSLGDGKTTLIEMLSG